MTSARQAEAQRMMRELQQKMRDVYFDYDSSAIRDDAHPVLKDVAAALGKAKGVKVVVEGHCDDRGTAEYNLALGEKRSHAAKEYLIALGIPSSRIETISYGKEKQICSSATDECWAKNRRAHFTLIEEGR
jgi:peptidoglycan-associated lipoprotein